MCDEVKYVIADDVCDDNFGSALTNNPNLISVKSNWIFDTHVKLKYTHIDNH